MTRRQEMSRTEKEIKMKEASERAAKIREFREIVIARRSHNEWNPDPRHAQIAAEIINLEA